MLRKLLGLEVSIDAQRITSLGRFEEGRRPKGHADKAAKALRLAETQGYALLVFIKDVDRQPGAKKSDHERRAKLRAMHEQIEHGFAAVDGADHVLRVKGAPCRMIEAWALGDVDALDRVRARRGRKAVVPARPETLWGKEQDPASNHPKCVLARVLGENANALVFEELAREASEETLRHACPESFAPFADEVRAAARGLRRRSAGRAT
jgi:hypothetical protein